MQTLLLVAKRDGPEMDGAQTGQVQVQDGRSSVAAFASTASHRTFVTIAIAPLVAVRRAKLSH